MVASLFIDLLSFAALEKPKDGLESRMTAFLESDESTESLDDCAFNLINRSETKADYLLGNRGLIAELKTLNGSPLERTENRLKTRLAQPSAPIVFGTMGGSKVIEGLPDQHDISKMMIDMSGRAVRKHLKKANDQIGAIKERLGLADVGGLVVLMNDAEPMIDAPAIGYTLKNAFETIPGGYPHITNVWVSIESHRIAMPDGRTGYPQLHVFKSLQRQRELDFIARMLSAWGHRNGSRMERLKHGGNWGAMRPIYDGPTPTLQPFE
jgi:hypothetical protein